MGVCDDCGVVVVGVDGGVRGFGVEKRCGFCCEDGEGGNRDFFLGEERGDPNNALRGESKKFNTFLAVFCFFGLVSVILALSLSSLLHGFGGIFDAELVKVRSGIMSMLVTTELSSEELQRTGDVVEDAIDESEEEDMVEDIMDGFFWIVWFVGSDELLFVVSDEFDCFDCGFPFL